MNAIKTLCLASLLYVAAVSLPACQDLRSPNLTLRWTKSTPMPDPTSDYAAGALGGKLIIAGGAYWEPRRRSERTFIGQLSVADGYRSHW